MSEEFLLEKSKPKKSSNLLILVSFGALIISCIALFVALNNYILDERYKTRVAGLHSRLQALSILNSRNQRVFDEINAKANELDGLVVECEGVLGLNGEDNATLVNGTSGALDLYAELNNTISGANTTCINEIYELNSILNQLLSVVNGTGRLVRGGTCQVNGTLDLVEYEYKLLELSGLDFYYYVFGNATGNLVECSPVIFRGPVSEHLVGGGVIATVGEEKIVFSAPPMMGFKLWINLF